MADGWAWQDGKPSQFRPVPVDFGSQRVEVFKRPLFDTSPCSANKQTGPPNGGPGNVTLDDTSCTHQSSTGDCTASMATQVDTPDIGKLHIDDDDTEDLFASPESGATTQKHTPTSNAPSHTKHQRAPSQSEAHDARLRAELERVKEVNRVIEGVTASLTKAKENMGMVQRTVENASTLLATWTRILSQTEHNQRLILNPRWHGVTQDLEDLESEDARRQQEAERRAVEDQRRREETLRRVEEEERRRAAVTPTAGRGLGKTRGSRGAPASGRGHVGVGGQSGRGRGAPDPSRGSGIGRGVVPGRSRGRGLS